MSCDRRRGVRGNIKNFDLSYQNGRVTNHLQKVVRGTEFLGWERYHRLNVAHITFDMPSRSSLEMSGRQLKSREAFWWQPGDMILEVISIHATGWDYLHLSVDRGWKYYPWHIPTGSRRWGEISKGDTGGETSVVGGKQDSMVAWKTREESCFRRVSTCAKCAAQRSSRWGLRLYD